MIEIGVIGCGHIAEVAHIPAILDLDGARLTALADPDAGRFRAVSALAPGARHFEDYRTLIREASPDAVIVCLPSEFHADAACASFDAGLHAYIEKPMATSLEDARRVLEAHERANTVCAMGFNFRFGAEFRKACSLIRDGALGPVTHGATEFSSASRGRTASWKNSRAGGAMLNLGSHHMDLIPELFGARIASVSAVIESRRTKDDHAALHLTLESGVPVQCVFSSGSAAADRITVVGEEGRLEIDRFAGSLRVAGRTVAYGRSKRVLGELRRFADGLASALRPPGEPSYARSVSAFVESILTGRPPAVSPVDGYRSLLAVLAAERSAARGRPVTLSEMEEAASETAASAT